MKFLRNGLISNACEAMKDENINVGLKIPVVIYWKHLNAS